MSERRRSIEKLVGAGLLAAGAAVFGLRDGEDKRPISPPVQEKNITVTPLDTEGATKNDPSQHDTERDISPELPPRMMEVQRALERSFGPLPLWDPETMGDAQAFFKNVKRGDYFLQKTQDNMLGLRRFLYLDFDISKREYVSSTSQAQEGLILNLEWPAELVEDVQDGHVAENSMIVKSGFTYLDNNQTSGLSEQIPFFEFEGNSNDLGAYSDEIKQLADLHGLPWNDLYQDGLDEAKDGQKFVVNRDRFREYKERYQEILDRQWTIPLRSGVRADIESSIRTFQQMIDEVEAPHKISAEEE